MLGARRYRGAGRQARKLPPAVGVVLERTTADWARAASVFMLKNRAA
jgi:hypothetical protein